MPFWSKIRFGRFLSTDAITGQPQAKRGGPFLKLSLATGFTLFGICSYRNFQDAKEKQSVYDISPYKLALYRIVPLNCITNIAGKLASMKVPLWLRKPIYGAYSWIYSCDLGECAPLESYQTFNEFFTRPLNAQRPVAGSTIVSPADGKILAFGKLDKSGDLYPEQIKGVRYPIKNFLRESPQLSNNDYDLYYCSIYLAPGSYHRFHSPVENFRVKKVQSIFGEALPVAPWVMRIIPGLVSLNERAVIKGHWGYGQMYMVPVGATNVKSITLKEDLRCLRKGQEMGQFEMGSLVVLLFEAPKNLEWTSDIDRWVKYGESIGQLQRPSTWSFWPF